MRPTLRLVSVVTSALLLASCSDATTGPSGPTSPELTNLLTEMSLSNVAGASTFAAPVAGVAFSSGPIAPHTCTYSSATGSFTCPTVTVNGLTFTRSFTLRDAAGRPLSEFGRNVASIQTSTTMKGTITASRPTGSSSLQVDRSEDVTLSGIGTADRTLNGHAISLLDGSVTGPTGSLQIKTKSTETTQDLVLPRPSSGNRWPQRGTITVVSESSITPNGQQVVTSSSTHTITFNGTSVVTITFTTGFGTVTCQVDLAKPGGVQTCSPLGV